MLVTAAALNLHVSAIDAQMILEFHGIWKLKIALEAHSVLLACFQVTLQVLLVHHHECSQICGQLLTTGPIRHLGALMGVPIAADMSLEDSI